MQITLRHWLLALALAVGLHVAFFLLSGLQQDKQTSLAGGGTQISLDLAGDGQTAAESLQEAAVRSASAAVSPEETSEASEAVPEETQQAEETSEIMAETTPVAESQSETRPQSDVQTEARSEETLEQSQPREETADAVPEEEMAEATETSETADAVEVNETAEATEQVPQEAAEPETQTAQAVPEEEPEQTEQATPPSRPDQAPPRKPQNRQVTRKPPQQEPQETTQEETEPAPEEPTETEGSQQEEQAALGNSGAGASETTSGGETQDPGTGDAEAADALQRYLGELSLWLERHKDYPRAARQRRQEGTAILRFVIDREGRVLDYSIEQSAGHSLLDREVEAMIERARPLPEPPDEIQRTRLEFRVPLAFRLR